jgi:catechol 2,3-dioxygenase-like lactoylglutathione lyase family enzyme
MKRFHVAISTPNIQDSVEDYTLRLGCPPTLVIEKEYALWRTETLNFSIRKDTTLPPGSMRHLGWEDSQAETFSAEKDCNGILWERFSARHQEEEILEIWPDAKISED